MFDNDGNIKRPLKGKCCDMKVPFSGPGRADLIWLSIDYSLTDWLTKWTKVQKSFVHPKIRKFIFYPRQTQFPSEWCFAMKGRIEVPGDRFYTANAITTDQQQQKGSRFSVIGTIHQPQDQPLCGVVGFSFLCCPWITVSGFLLLVFSLLFGCR